MTLLACSSRISSTDADRLDITIAGQHPIGVVFAPSSPLFKMVKNAMREADELERQAGDLYSSFYGQRAGLLDEAEALRTTTWAHYEPAYVAEMRESYRKHRGTWDALLARPRVVCCCFCVLTPDKPQRCHRVLLRGILVKLGAVDGGEI